MRAVPEILDTPIPAGRSGGVFFRLVQAIVMMWDNHVVENFHDVAGAPMECLLNYNNLKSGSLPARCMQYEQVEVIP